MSKNIQERENEFILVKGRKGRGVKSTFSELITNNDKNILTPTEITQPSPEIVIRKIKAAIDHLKETDYFKLFNNVLHESLEELWKDDKTERTAETIKIVCYGLGTFTDCIIARYQLAFLVLLRDEFKTSVEIFDPVFTSQEKDILSGEYGFIVLSENEEGKRKVDNMTLFYLPHCSHQLVNNLLYSNWSSERLRNCIIVSNSFINLRQSLVARLLSEFLMFINRVQAVDSEYAVVNCFQFTDIFNDTAIHIFPCSKLDQVDKGFWLAKEVPVYVSSDFVTVSKSSLDCEG